MERRVRGIHGNCRATNAELLHGEKRWSWLRRDVADRYDQFTGPNSPLGHGSLFGALEASANYTLKRCSKMASEGIKSVTVKPDVLREFNDYSQAFLQQLCIHRVADRGTRTTRSMAV